MQSGSKTSADLVPSDSPEGEGKEAQEREAQESEARESQGPQEAQEPRETLEPEEAQEAQAPSPEGKEESEESPEEESLGTRSEIETLSGCKRRLKASIPVEKVREELEKNYRELTRAAQLPGFRKGRVPRKLLEARFGEEVEADVKQALLSQSFSEVMEEKDLKVIGSTKFDKIEFNKDSDLSYEVELEVRPEFELGEYKGIEVKLEVSSVKDEDVEEHLKALQRNQARATPADPGALGADDIYVGKYHLYRDGLKVKTSETMAFTPSSRALHVFEVEDLPERVKAWQPASGNPLKIPLKIPDNFSDEVLRGAQAELEFIMEEGKHLELPELNDEFAKIFGETNMADLRVKVRESLEARRSRKEDAKVVDDILEKIIASTSIELPEGLLENQKRRWALEREYELLQGEGLSPEQLKEKVAREGDAAVDDLRRGLKEFFILEAIAEKEKIFATEKEVEERLELLAALHVVPAQKLREEMKKAERLEELRHNLRQEKVRAFLRKHAKITVPEVTIPEVTIPEVTIPEAAGGEPGVAPSESTS